MYLFFIWGLILIEAIPLLGPLEEVGPENLDFFGAWNGRWAMKISTFWAQTALARCRFRAQKSLEFQGPPLPMAQVMELPRSKSRPV
jgi:hypothetical protein